MPSFFLVDVYTSPSDYLVIGEVKRRRQPWSGLVMVTIVMFGVLLTSDVIVYVTASTSNSNRVNDSHIGPTKWLREFINNIDLCT